MQGDTIHIEHEILKRFKAGDEMAFEIIFHRSKGKLMGFLKNTLPKGEDSESVLQESYLKLWNVRKDVDVNQKIEALIFTIARNIVIDIMRKRLTKQKYLERYFSVIESQQLDNHDTLKNIEYSEMEKIIFELIEELPEKRRIIFELSRLEGLSYKAIAQKLDITENTVDTQIRSALSHMRNGVEKYIGMVVWIYLNT